VLRDGEVRYSWTDQSLNTTPAYELTKYTFMGQYSYMDDPSTISVTEGFGLMYYNARWYDPALGRSSGFRDIFVFPGVARADLPGLCKRVLRPPPGLVVAIIVVRQAAQVSTIYPNDVNLTTVNIAIVIEVSRKCHPVPIRGEAWSLAVTPRR